MCKENSKFREIKNISQKLLSRLTYLPSAKKIAAAVSGGCDSVALLLVLQHFCQIKQIPLVVFHVDHQLRESSKKDCKWVQELAKDKGFEFFYRVVDKKDLSDLKKSGIEAWARNVRYRCFIEMAAESGTDLIATGHTADDQLETLLMRFFSGSSLQGAAAIRSFSQIKVAGKNLNLWRPFLRIQRNELENYLELIGQSWLNDETNFSDDFLRNRVRHHLIPTVKEIFPKAAEKVACFCSDLDEVQNFMLKQARSYIKHNLHGNALNLSEQDPVLIREIMRQWLIKLNLGLKTTRALLNRLVELWQKKEQNRKVDHRSFRFVRKKNKIVFLAVDFSCEDK